MWEETRQARDGHANAGTHARMHGCPRAKNKARSHACDASMNGTMAETAKVMRGRSSVLQLSVATIANRVLRLGERVAFPTN